MSPSMQPIAVSSNQDAPTQSTKHASCACVGPGQPRPGYAKPTWLGTDVNQSDPLGIASDCPDQDFLRYHEETEPIAKEILKNLVE